MRRYLLKRLTSDQADAELVSMMVAMVLIPAALFTTLDATFYFDDRGLVTDAARSTARTVAILGGGGTATTQTPLEASYGDTVTDACKDVASYPRVAEAYSSLSTPVECNLMKSLATDKGLLNLKISAVKCDPEITTYIGQRTSCAVQWSYGGLPGSAMSFMHLGAHNTTVGTSESEVNLSTSRLIPRS